MLKISHLFWILIVYSCDESTIFAGTTSPVQTFVGWNASFNIQLDPYPSNDSIITIAKNGTLLMWVKGTHGQEVAERFEFTGNTFENQISFILRNVTIGDAGTYYATVTGLSSRGEQILIVKGTTSPVQTFVGWNASFSIQLNPYPRYDSVIQIAKNGTVLMWVKGTNGQKVAERFEFTGNTFENQISFILRNVAIGDAGTYYATETGLSSAGEQILIVKVAPSTPKIVAITGSAVLGSDYRLKCSSVSNSAPPDHGLTMMSEWKVNGQLITAGGRYKVQGTELTIASLTRQDNNGRLTCVIYEDSLMKSIPSNELVIDVMYGPGNSVNLGSNSSTLIVDLHQRAPDITCSATCNPPCDYRWYHNRTLYSDGATLSLGVVTNKTSGGNYTCEAFNRLLGSEWSSSTSVSIHVYCLHLDIKAAGSGYMSELSSL